MARDLRNFFDRLGRAKVPARLSVTRSAVREAERLNRAAASWYMPLCEWADELGEPRPDPALFNFKELADLPEAVEPGREKGAA